ncbi:alpha/beta fold hydrolase [Plastoroseomonas hellenica]|uniref:alpha/beta fold hydrolase n=1 Tax=Plastoroseomonas hellenica TaxID=2687306 RepID=UPI001BAD6DEF|nr:alpha/beta hydrolase [Plastoroseomonas hellenica]MBR0645274.1 alpha/beta hydrolase [Plastoroseomonas hellenica]
MPYAPAEGARLYYEETGKGHPIVFVHEYGSDHREWETQVRFFSREYRCITFAARGYAPSEVPSDPRLYGQDFACADIAAVMRHLGIPSAHVVGLSMGAFAALLFGIRHPQMATALVVAGVGTGSDLAELDAFRVAQAARAEQIRQEGWGALAVEQGLSPTRIQLRKKDPRGWEEFVQHLREHSAEGSGLTMRHYQGARDPVYAWEERLRAMRVPTLLAVGDEDAPCIEPNIFLKRTLPNAGLWMHPRTGHAINLEEPAAFNRAVQDFFSTVERGRWSLDA